MIHASPAVVVRADTPIAECIALMNARKVGSVLIAKDGGSEELIGIFTERDLLYQSTLLRSGDFWTKPVRTVMSSPVISIDVSEMDEAAQIMLRGGFRHLPVYSEGRLGGVVSIRDLLKAYLQGELPRKSEAPLAPPKSRQALESRTRILHVMAPKGTLLGLLRQLSLRFKRLEVHQVEDEGLSAFAKGEIFAVDLDSIKSSDWSRTCTALSKAKHMKRVLLFLNPALYPEADLGPLSEFEEDARFFLFAKPVDLMELMRKLESLAR